MEALPAGKISYDLAVAGIEDETNRARRLRDEGDLGAARLAESKIEMYRRKVARLRLTFSLDDMDV